MVYAHKPGQMIVDECFGAGTDARSLTGAQLVQVTRRMAELIVEVIDGTLSPLAQALMQTGLLPAGVTPEIITLSGGVGECYRHQPADPFCFADIGPLLATALHDHPRLREMNVQFPAQTVRATVIGAGAHTLSLSGSTIWLEGVQLPLRNLPVAIPIDEKDLVSAWQQALIQLDLDPKTDAYVLALPASLPVRYAAVLTVINALVDFVARFPNPHPLLVVAGQDFGKALGMLLRPQLQQLPLAVIDEVIVRAGLEDHFMGKLSGISMGCDCCYTNHADADQNLNENLMILLATAGCNYIMGMPLGDDIMLNYQTTAFHDTATVRQLLNLRPSPEFERWLESMGIMANGRLTKRAGDPSLFF